MILDRVLSSLGLPGWLRNAYFEYHAHVRLRFKLASGLGEPWTRDGGTDQGCPLIWLLMRGFSLSCMLTTLNVSLGIPTCSLVLLGSLLAMSGFLVRSLLLVNASF